MNILLLCDEYPPGRHGGIGSAVQLLARKFVSMGHKVIVAGFAYIGYGGQDEYNDEGVQVYVHRLKLASPFFERQDAISVRVVMRLLTVTGTLQADIRQSLHRYGVFLNELIKTHNIDIVEMPDYNDYVRLCRKEVYFPVLDAPIVVKLHGSITYFNKEAGESVPGHVWNMEKYILDNATAVVSVSRYTAEKTARYFKYNKDIPVLYNGVAMPDVPANVYKEKGKVIFTGSLVEKKGIYKLMQAWNIVAKARPAARLVIFGKGPVKKISAELDATAKDSVAFKGHVPRAVLMEELATANAAVFPSFAETFGLGPAEAMACNTAVVFSTRTSGPEIVDDGITGFLVDPDDVEAIAAKVITLLDDEVLCSQLAANGRLSVASRFDVNIVAAQHIRFYQSVLKSKKKTQQE